VIINIAKLKVEFCVDWIIFAWMFAYEIFGGGIGIGCNVKIVNRNEPNEEKDGKLARSSSSRFESGS